MQHKEQYQYNEKGERHGVWVMYWSDGKLNYTESYINGEVVGYSKSVYYTDKTHDVIDISNEIYVAR